MPSIAYHIVKNGTIIHTVFTAQEARTWAESCNATIKKESLL